VFGSSRVACSVDQSSSLCSWYWTVLVCRGSCIGGWEYWVVGWIVVVSGFGVLSGQGPSVWVCLVEVLTWWEMQGVWCYL